jgi:hypothetical protein
VTFCENTDQNILYYPCFSIICVSTPLYQPDNLEFTLFLFTQETHDSHTRWPISLKCCCPSQMWLQVTWVWKRWHFIPVQLWVGMGFRGAHTLMWYCTPKDEGCVTQLPFCFLKVDRSMRPPLRSNTWNIYLMLSLVTGTSYHTTTQPNSETTYHALLRPCLACQVCLHFKDVCISCLVHELRIGGGCTGITYKQDFSPCSCKHNKTSDWISMKI